MAGQLKLGLDLSGQTLYAYTATAKTLPSSTTTVMQTSGGYSIVEDNESFKLVRPSNSYTPIYHPSYSLPYSRSIALPEDVGFITYLDTDADSIGMLTRDDNSKIYAFTEDGDKVALPRFDTPETLSIESGIYVIEGNSYASVQKNYSLSDYTIKPKMVLLNGVTTNHSGSLGINSFSAVLSGNQIVCSVVIRNLGSSARNDTKVTWTVTVM